MTTIEEGWSNLLNKKPEIEKVAKKRLSLCSQCFVSDYGKSKFCKFTNGGCGCPLAAKVRSPRESCPLGVWKSVKVKIK